MRQGVRPKRADAARKTEPMRDGYNPRAPPPVANPPAAVPMRIFVTLIKWILLLGLALGLTGVVTVIAGYTYLEPRLPPVDSLKDVRLQVPLRVYSRDRKLIWSFGEQRRTPAAIGDIPVVVKQAFLAAEDDRFYSHAGVDVKGLAAAAFELITTGQKRRGGSTITMQVARNYFLSREKSYLRKINEILLALKIERELNKDEILALYLNKIYLGHRAYGVAAAAQVYYGVPLDGLQLHQAAMIAGLPKAPSTGNPVTNPQRAATRRAYVLGRMRTLGYITEEPYRQAMDTPDDARLHDPPVELDAPYIAEMARAQMVERFGEAAYADGYQVYTRIESGLQKAADAALRKSLLEYTRRHGYRGPEARWEPPAGETALDPEQTLQSFKTLGGLQPALVTAVAEKSATVHVQGRGVVNLDWDAISWARLYIDESRRGPEPKQAADILSVGDVARLEPVDATTWRLAQLPEAEGALAALDPEDGGILALVGGFDFHKSKFNRAAQAERQAGSSLKPFVYTAALAKGFTPATIINDAPVVFEDRALEGAWRPENYSGKVFGPTRLREALIRSRNLVSIRLLRKIGIPYTVDFLTQVGFPREALPRNLSLSLGSASVTPLRLAAAFAALANGGHKVEPWLIERIEDADGQTLYEAQPATVCSDCVAGNAPPDGRSAAPRVMPEEDVYLMYTILREVITRGTGRRAHVLKRTDLAGKTGTTNNQQDAWFSGFNRRIAATAWVGFDRNRPLGSGETGGRAALPAWIDFMKTALADMPDSPLAPPPGIVRTRIDPETGRGARPGNPNAVFEVFRAGTEPAPTTVGSAPIRTDALGDAPRAPGPGPSGAPASAPPPTEIF